MNSKRNLSSPLTFLKAICLGFLFTCLLSCNQSKGTLESDFEGWEIFGAADWTIEEGILHGTVNDTVGFVMSKAAYSSFRLTVEFKPNSSINSGIYLRCQNKEISFVDCYEFNIWDLHPNQDFRTGAVVNIAPPLNYVETIDQWNTYEIELKDNKLKAWVNGVQTVDLEDPSLKEGFIALQAMGSGEVSFRKLKIQDLSKK
ncbi:DUF1080 domain-containing protein [Algoriphagus namhaensis]|uniref:DUF1080 domain-containing protein n=1 Tax=Algoriphagus namhaensis TaxID=915353 RepID=A0ABV8AWL0_9BACT